MPSRKLLAAAVAALVALALVAAGAAGATKTQTLHLKADPSGQFKFTTGRLVAKSPGRITLSMKNPSSSGISHGIAVSGKGVSRKGRTVIPGGTSHVTVTLKKGRYTFYCPVAGHRALGMKGTLIVR